MDKLRKVAAAANPPAMLRAAAARCILEQERAARAAWATPETLEAMERVAAVCPPGLTIGQANALLNAGTSARDLELAARRMRQALAPWPARLALRLWWWVEDAARRWMVKRCGKSP